MKHTCITLPLLALFIFSCGNKDEKKDGTEKTETTENKTEEAPKRLTPADISLDKPLLAYEANAAIMGWNEKTVDVAGYVYTFYGDSASVDYGGLTLLMGKGSTKQAISVSLKDSKKFKVHKNDMIHLRGRITGTYFDTLVAMRDAEVIAIAANIKTESLDPSKEKRVLDAGQLKTDYTQWNNLEIAVKGDYMMTTTSTTSYGKTIRVDLKNEKSQYADVGCEFAEDPSAKLENNRKDVIVTGKIRPGGAFGKLQLYDCKLVNR